MAYFVFRISPDRQLTPVASFEAFREAREACRKLRAAESPEDANAVRMVFAQNEAEARRLLSEKRQPSSPVEEWEA